MLSIFQGVQKASYMKLSSFQFC